MKLFFSLLTAAVLFANCGKIKDIKGKQEKLYIRGRLFLTDTLTQYIINQPLGGKVVQLAENNGDTLNYLYSDTTDSDGYFLFDLLNNTETDKKFILRYDEKVNGYWYTARDTVVKGEDNLAMEARLNTAKQNGFYIYVRDSLGGNIPGATVSIYNSQVLAEVNDPAGAVETITASGSGRAMKLNLPAGTYYLNAKKQVDSIIFQRLKRQVTIPAAGIILPSPDTIMLLKKR